MKLCEKNWGRSYENLFHPGCKSFYPKSLNSLQNPPAFNSDLLFLTMKPRHSLNPLPPQSPMQDPSTAQTSRFLPR